MNKKEEIIEDNESVREILDIVKVNYNQYYGRIQSIDNKNGFFIAFHGAVLMLIVNSDSIKNILNMQYRNVGQILKNRLIVLFGMSILILAVVSICLFICGLKSRNIKYMLSNICDGKYYKSSDTKLRRQLLKAYKEIFEHNENIIDKKHTLFNYGATITLIEVILMGINLIIQIF